MECGVLRKVARKGVFLGRPAPGGDPWEQEEEEHARGLGGA